MVGTVNDPAQASSGFDSGRCVVISQPMYFPWVGQLEQLRLSDAFVFYDDVQFSRGGFSNRVQIKTAAGIRWLTVPLKDFHLGQLIQEVQINNGTNWQRSHRDSFRQAYARAPFLQDALDLLDSVFDQKCGNLAELSMASTIALATYFDLDAGRAFPCSSGLDIAGHSTRRVIDVCLNQKAKVYLTGHGARNYLDCQAFEDSGVDVSYIAYGLTSYVQLHGSFTPYVTALDLVANCGRQGREWIVGRPVPWRIFMGQQTYQNQESS